MIVCQLLHIEYNYNNLNFDVFYITKLNIYHYLLSYQTYKINFTYVIYYYNYTL